MGSSLSLDSWEAQVRKGVLEYILLKELKQKPSYGYDLVSRVQQYGGMEVSESAVYLSLSRLSRDKLIIATAVKSDSGPMRKQYEVTAFGSVKLAQMRSFILALASSLLADAK